MRMCYRLVSFAIVAAFVVTGCGGGDDSSSGGNGGGGGSTSLTDSDQALLETLSQSFISFGNSIGQRSAAGKVRLGGTIRSSTSMGPPPSYMPVTVTVTFENEGGVMPGSIINGTESITVSSQTSINGTMRIGVTWTDSPHVHSRGEPPVLSGELLYSGTFTGNPSAGTMTFDCYITDEQDFSVDSIGKDVDLHLRVTVSNGVVHGNMAGTINGLSVNQEI